MKRTAEKVALAAFVSISLIFVVICLLTYMNVIPLNGGGVYEIDWALTVILLVLGGIWMLLAVYLLFVNFAQRSVLKYVMLYSDCHSSTRATSRVIKRLAVRESKQLAGMKIKKVNISSNEHLGLNMKIILEISNDDVAFSIDTLRYLLTDKYREVLGLEFAAMDFQIQKVRSGYRADLGKAQSHAKRLSDKRRRCTSASCHIEHSENEQGEVSGNLAVASVDDDGENVLVTDDKPTENSDKKHAEQQNQSNAKSNTEQEETQGKQPEDSGTEQQFSQYEEQDTEQKSDDNAEQQNDGQPQQTEPQEQSVSVADEQTKNRIAEQNRKQREEQAEKNRVKAIYGTPESPITDDILVEIDDENENQSMKDDDDTKATTEQNAEKPKDKKASKSKKDK